MKNIDEFIELGKSKYGDKYDYSVSEYSGQSKPIKIICPTHGEVELPTAKSHLVRSGCSKCDLEKVKKGRKGKYSKQKGNAYELQIIKELIELGYDGLKSSRSESKNLDNDKIDIADPNGILPFYVQCKCTKIKPSYEKNINDCPRKDKPMVIFHNQQSDKGLKMGSDGEFIIMTKEYFYKLIKLKK